MTEALPHVHRDKSFLPEHYQPSSVDVICARGTKSFDHCGNKSFRKAIASNLAKYGACIDKRDKSMIVSSIANEFYFNGDERKRCQFIRFCASKKLWYEISYDQVRQKVGQTMRDTLLQHDPQRLSRKKQSRARRASTRDFISSNTRCRIFQVVGAVTRTRPDENTMNSLPHGHPDCDKVPRSIQVKWNVQQTRQNVSILGFEQQLCRDVSLANPEWATSGHKATLEAAHGTYVDHRRDASDSDSLSVLSCQWFPECDESSLSNCDWLDHDNGKLWK